MDKDIPLSWERLNDIGAAHSTTAPNRVAPITLIFVMWYPPPEATPTPSQRKTMLFAPELRDTARLSGELPAALEAPPRNRHDDGPSGQHHRPHCPKGDLLATR